MKFSHLLRALILVLWLGLTAAPVLAVPPLPSGYYGTATENNVSVPEGASVTAWVNGVRCGQTTASTWNGSAVYSLDCGGDDSETAPIEGGREGDVVTFRINGQNTVQTGIWHSGSSTALNLNVTGAAPAVVSVTPGSGHAGTAVAINVVGSATHFMTGTTQLALGSGITITSISVADATHLQANLVIAADAAAGSRTLALTTGAETITHSAAFTVIANGIRVTPIKDATGARGTYVDLPILLLDPLPAQTGYAYEFTLAFDPTVLQFREVVAAGTLSEHFFIAHSIGAGQVTLAAYGTTPLSGTGQLVGLRFSVIGSPGVETDLTLTDFTFDEGEPVTVRETGHFTVTSPRIELAGRLFYYRNLRPVTGAVCTLTGTAVLTSGTSTSGTYSLVVHQVGDYTVAPSKAGGDGNALSALDAAWITQYAAGYRNFGEDQRLACDVSLNGDCTSLDASLIARYLIGDPIAAPVGTWRFDPQSRTYSQFEGTLLHEDYVAYLVGDVTYNWGSVAGQLRSLQMQEKGVEVRLPALQSGGQALFTVPVQVTDLTDLGVLGYEITVTFDPNVVRFENIDQNGSLSRSWYLFENHAVPGQIKIVGYGLSPLSGSGTLLNLHFTAIGQAEQETVLGLQRVQLNEGNPLVYGVAGRVSIDSAYKVLLPLILR